MTADRNDLSDLSKARRIDIVGVVWTRSNDNEWARHLLRREQPSKRLDWSPLHHVRREYGTFCLACLSQKLQPCKLDSGWYDCESCGAFFALPAEIDFDIPLG